MTRTIVAWSRRGVAGPLVAAGLVLMVGCSDSRSSVGPSPMASPTPVPPPAPPPTPVTSVIARGGSPLGPSTLLHTRFTTTAAGTIGATVDWTHPTNDIDVYLTRGAEPCTLEQVNEDQCPFIGVATSLTAKPETLSVPDLAAGQYVLYIGNYGSDESVSYEVTLTSMPGASGASTSHTDTASRAAGKGDLRRIVSPR
jgi:hypothetical protein